jgi:acyl-coenzyme A thioesterase PaaI-like protein
MTRHMEVDYLRPVPSGAPLRLEGRITHNEGRKHWTESKILNADGTLLAQGKGLFIEVRARQPETPTSAAPAN